MLTDNLLVLLLFLLVALHYSGTSMATSGGSGPLAALVLPPDDIDNDLAEEYPVSRSSGILAALTQPQTLSIPPTKNVAFINRILKLVSPAKNKRRPNYDGSVASGLTGDAQLPFEDRHCRMVCDPCEKHMSTKWAALCWVHCHRGGKAFDACVTLVSVLEGVDIEE